MEKIHELGIAADDYFYLIEGDRVKKKIRCTIKFRDYQHPSCKALSVFFHDRIRFHFTFSRAYEGDWIAIGDRLADWLTSFERPLDAFPQQATHQEHEPARNQRQPFRGFDLRIALKGGVSNRSWFYDEAQAHCAQQVCMRFKAQRLFGLMACKKIVARTGEAGR
ncbi:MAG: hypothetical protein LBI59_09740 [Candidatus Accumulibacter sp.]|nr:hypothetical protein [Accumulibacter sp.]